MSQQLLFCWPQSEFGGDWRHRTRSSQKLSGCHPKNIAENRAKIEDNRALVVLAEAEVPKAMADAFRQGNLGIMDYYRMKNIQADTAMRGSIGEGDGSADKKG